MEIRELGISRVVALSISNKMFSHMPQDFNSIPSLF